MGLAYTIRFVRDGSNVITIFGGTGTAPLALVPVVLGSNDAPFTTTQSGTLARIEFSLHTPSAAGASARWDGYVDWLASL